MMRMYAKVCCRKKITIAIRSTWLRSLTLVQIIDSVIDSDGPALTY